METLSFVLDAILVLILVMTIIDGRRKGFFTTVFSLVATAIAVLVAHEYSAPFAEWANENLVQNAAVNALANSISSYIGDGSQAVINSIPDYIISAAQASGVEIQEIVSNLGSSVDAVSIAEQIYGGIYGIIVFPILSVIAFLIIFAISKSILSFGVSFINNVFKLPILKGLNKTLGGVIGAVKGVLVIGIIGVLLVVCAPIMPEEFSSAVTSSTIPNIFAELILK
jgi:uncharacterized membrane protein required for colicin V production